jgi:hypothetical protein
MAITRKAAKDMLDAGYLSQAKYDMMVKDGAISAGRKPKGTVTGMLNLNGHVIVPSLYLKGNAGQGEESFTPEMKEFKIKFAELVQQYCEELEKQEVTIVEEEEVVTA